MPLFVLMEQFVLSFLIATFTIHSLSLLAQPTSSPESQITVEGNVYCDPCFTDDFSKFSYFMQGVDVHIQCKLKANPPGTSEIITFSVNRTTNRKGVFRLEIPHVDGVDCVEGPPIQFSCQAHLIRSTSSACNVPGTHTTTYQLSVKSKQANQCVYSFPGMSFRPIERNDTLCGKRAEEDQKVYPQHHGFHYPWFPHPKPKASSVKFPFMKSPTFGFPFPRARKPINQPIPFVFPPPPPPAFSLEDPRTWFPHNPLQTQSPPPPPPPMFNPWDPRTWPQLTPPPPPAGPQYEKP